MALSKSRNLFQAAEVRNVTHPAFGRRLKALEEWAGVPLVEPDLRAGVLVRADSARNDIHMEIRLYQAAANAKPLARQVWGRIEVFAAR